MKKILTMAIALFVTISFAQNKKKLSHNPETNLIDVVFYHDNGVISQTGTYTLDGKLQGEWVSYNQDGSKIVIANYTNGKKAGKWFYYTNGTVKEVNYNANIIAVLKDSEIQ